MSEQKVNSDPVVWIKPDVAKTLRRDDCCYAFGSNSPKGNLIPLYTEQPLREAVQCLRKIMLACAEGKSLGYISNLAENVIESL